MRVRQAVNDYQQLQRLIEEVSELEQIELLYGYRQRGIVITYVTEDPVLIRFLNSVYLESLMLIYPTLSVARLQLQRILARPAAGDPDGILDPAIFLGAESPVGRPAQH